MRELIGPLLRFLLRPASIGALYVSALSAMAARGSRDVLADAPDLPGLAATVRAQIGAEAARTALALGAAAIAIGAALGVLAALLVTLRDRIARSPRRTAASRAWAVLGVTAVVHAWFFLAAMARVPQLYDESWYARGGARRTVQVLATDTLGPRGVVALGAVLLLVFLAGPPSRWRAWPSRLRRALAPGLSGRVAGLVAVGLAVSGLAAIEPAQATSAPAQPAPAPAGPSPARPNVLVLGVESLRADRLAPRTAPALAALAARGARFDRAFVSLPDDLASWVTLLTGRHPHHHGIRTAFPRWEERAKDFDALPRRFARAGYRVELAGDDPADVFSRVDLGLGLAVSPVPDLAQRARRCILGGQTALLPFLDSRAGRAAFPVLRGMGEAADPDVVADDVIRAIRRTPGKPFFVTAVFSGATAPYAARAPYYARFTRRAYRGRFKYASGPAEGGAPDDDDIAQIRGLYDGAVASVDAAVARVLTALAARGLADRTIVVVVSDHGETLFEAGRGLGHGDHLFGDEGTHVPLVVVDPRRKATAVRAIVRDVDLAPTLYALADVAPPPDLDGRSLVPWMDGADAPPTSSEARNAPVPAAPAPALAYAETGLWAAEDVAGVPAALRLPYPGVARTTEVDAAHGEVVLARAARTRAIVAKHRMARDERWKLVYAPTRAGAKYLLYDTELDPAEQRDVAAEHPAELARLKSELLAWMARDPEMRVSDDVLVPRDLSQLAPTRPNDARGGSP